MTRVALQELRNLLSLERTRLAADRMVMAWIRTAFSLITFGFAVVTFFEFLRERSTVVSRSLVGTPRALGLLPIGLGTASLRAGAREYRQLLVRLRELGIAQRASVAAVTVAILVGPFGALAFVGALLPAGAF
jgi:uncharacterized membrane protein YidH (DUF202 family)